MKYQELLKYGEKFLKSNFEAKELLTKVLKENDKEIPIKKVQKYKNLLQMRRSNVPLQYLMGFTYFHSRKFYLNHQVLIPRHDTETLIDGFQQIFQDKKEKLTILEIGVGSGCILLTLLKEYRNSFGLGLDISLDALEIFEKNQKSLKVKNCKAIPFDILNDNIDKLTLFEFDVIISNPPYIESDEIHSLESQVRDFEPLLALNGGRDGLKFYQRYLDMIKHIKTKYLILEIGHNQSKSVQEIFKDYEIQILKDLSGIDRCLIIKVK